MMALISNRTLKATVAGISLYAACGVAWASNIETNMAHMQAMDKITGRVSEIDVPVNGEAKFGSFSIVVRRCVTRSPEETPENTAFVDVVDNYNTDDPVNIFKGWMFSSTPALNAVEHPIYDVWLLKCYNADLNGKKLLSEDELILRDEVPMQNAKDDTKPINISVGDTEGEEKETTENIQTAETSNAENMISSENSEKSQPAEVIAVVVTDDEPQDNGAPKALLQVQAQPSVLDEENAVVPEETLSREDDIPSEGVDTSIDDENAFVPEDDEENAFISEEDEFLQ